MLSRTRLAVAFLILVAACSSAGSEGATTSSEIQSADSVARAFVAALVEEDYEATAPLVDERHVAFLTAVERGSASEIAGMLRSGLTEDVRADFWSSFAESLPRQAGQSIGRVQVSAVVDEFTVDGADFAAVEFSIGGGASEWLLRRAPDGWVVDLLATFGTGFLPNLRGWFTFISTDSEVDFIREEFRRELPSVEAALQRLPLGPLSPEVQGIADQFLDDFGR